MALVGNGIRGLAMEGPVVATVAINGSGANSAAYSFSPANSFVAAPKVLLIPPRGVNGTWSVTSITTSGFTFAISGATDVASENVEVGVFAHEPL